MAIHAISGKPGGGKTLYAVKLVLDELIYGSRVVITNVAFRLPELNVYLQRMHPNRSVDLFGRLRILSDEDTSGFWTFRPAVDEVGKLLAGFHRIPLLDKSQWEAGDLPCYAGVRDHGVMYVIDECHNFFNARAWMKTGRDVLFYLSQHRKLGDTVVWITQAVSNVDKQFRSVTQDYTYVRNLSKEKMGMFRLPSRFLRRSYGEPATATSQCMESGTFTVDVSGVASCYDTAQGVGIHTRSAADKSEKKKGVHCAWLLVGAPVALITLMHFAPDIVVHFLDGGHKRFQAVISGPALTNGVSAAVVSSTAFKTNAAVAVGGSVATNTVYMIGFATVPHFVNDYFVGAKSVHVYLSDGSEYQNGDGHLTFLSERYCVVDGVTNWYRAAAVTAPVVVEAPESYSRSVSEQPSPVVSAAGGSSVWYMPARPFGISRPAVRSATAQAGFGGGYSQTY